MFSTFYETRGVLLVDRLNRHFASFFSAHNVFQDRNNAAGCVLSAAAALHPADNTGPNNAQIYQRMTLSAVPARYF